MRRNCAAKAQVPGLIVESLFTRQAWNRCPKRLRHRPAHRALDARLNRLAAAIAIVVDAETVAVVAPEAAAVQVADRAVNS